MRGLSKGLIPSGGSVTTGHLPSPAPFPGCYLGWLCQDWCPQPCNLSTSKTIEAESGDLMAQVPASSLPSFEEQGPTLR